MHELSTSCSEIIPAASCMHRIGAGEVEGDDLVDLLGGQLEEAE